MKLVFKNNTMAEKLIFYCIILFPLGFIAGPLIADFLVSIVFLAFLYLHVVKKKIFFYS